MDGPAIGILGGTFDPPHIGHLLLGECARVQFGLQRVHFMPAGDPYHKADERDITPAVHRLAMTRLAVEDHPDFFADDREARREGPTYTVDTLRELHAEGHGDLALILGSDTIATLPSWQEWRELERLASLVVAPKGNSAGDIARLARETGLERTPGVIDMPGIAVSSTLIRERMREGKPVRYLVPDVVLAYARQHALYAQAD